ncbi:MAG: hypothetical protein R2942_16700 [Ignavibacteria bacterium]
MFVHFIITYPIKIEYRYRKLFLAILYISIFTFVLLRILTYGSNFSFLMNTLASIFAVLSIASGIYFLIRSYFRLNDSNLKKPMKVILIGFLGAVGFTYSLIISVLVKNA